MKVFVRFFSHRLGFSLELDISIKAIRLYSGVVVYNGFIYFF